MKPIEHLLLAITALAVFLSVGAYYHLTLRKDIRAQETEIAAVRAELEKLQKDPRLAEIDSQRAKIFAANRSHEQWAALQQVRRFTRLSLNPVRLTVAGSDAEALCKRLRGVAARGQPLEPQLGADGVVTVSFE